MINVAVLVLTLWGIHLKPPTNQFHLEVDLIELNTYCVGVDDVIYSKIIARKRLQSGEVIAWEFYTQDQTLPTTVDGLTVYRHRVDKKTFVLKSYQYRERTHQI